MHKNRNLIIAGGGTGGHVFAGISIAEEWKKKHPQSKILFVGASGGIEEKVVPRTRIPLVVLKMSSLKGVSLKKKLLSLLKIPLALLHAAKIMFQIKPSAVIGVGGYASGPMVLSARLLGFFFSTRVGIIEQNAAPGLTNRILSRFSHLVFCAFSGIEKKFSHIKNPSKFRVTGNPVRKEMVPQSPPAQDFPFTLFVFGGSQGAVGINSLVLDALPFLQSFQTQIHWIHQTGERDFERVKRGHMEQGWASEVSPFINDMVAAYQKSHLVICRSGSSTLAELAAVQRAAILIPFPQATDNHQELNANLFVEKNAALLMRQQEATGALLAQKIIHLLQSRTELSLLEKNISSFYHPDAAKIMIESISS